VAVAMAVAAAWENGRSRGVVGSEASATESAEERDCFGLVGLAWPSPSSVSFGLDKFLFLFGYQIPLLRTKIHCHSQFLIQSTTQDFVKKTASEHQFSESI
jgi:hypothetical protein